MMKLLLLFAVPLAFGAAFSLSDEECYPIVAWGNNDCGQCEVPEPNEGFIAVEGGICHTLGLKADGTVLAWGNNDYGQCEVPEPNEGFVAVARG